MLRCRLMHVTTNRCCRRSRDSVAFVSHSAVQLHPGCVAGGRHHFGRLRSHRLQPSAKTLARQQYVTAAIE